MRIINKISGLLFTFYFAQIFAQNPTWEYFNSYGYVTGLVERDSTIWVASSGGLVIHNKTTGNEIFLNKLNSALPDNNLAGMVKDPAGTIWIATKERGLVKYDGVSWTVYDTTNSLIPYNSINALCCDSSGNLWIASMLGTPTKFDGSTWTELTNAPLGWVTCMACDKFNNMWFGTFSNGLAKFDGTSWVFFNTSNSPISFNTIDVVTSDSSGNVLLANWGGLYKYNGQIITVVNIPGTFTTPQTLFIDPSQNLWIGDYFNGLIKFDGTNAFIYNPSNSGILSNHITAVLIDDEQKVWAGSYDSGMSSFDGQTWSSFSLTNSLRSCGVSAIAFEELSNTIWIGGTKGLSRFNSNNWINFNTLNSGLPDEYINDLTLDTGDVKVCGTGNGKVAFFDDQNWIVNTLADVVYSVSADNAGTLLAGCSDGFLFQYTGSGWNYLSSFMNLNFVNEINPDNNGNFWISTRRTGLWKYDGNTITIYNPSNSGIPDTNILSAAPDINGNVWIGTKNHGLVKFDGINWVNFTTSNSGLLHNQVNVVTCDQEGNVWLHPRMTGLTKFDGSTWTNYNIWNSNLHDRDLVCIEIDKSGNIWVGAMNGLMKIGGLITFVTDNDNNLKTRCFPNPFSSKTTIEFNLNKPASLSLEIYNIYGQKVKSLYQGLLGAGQHKFTWDGTQDGGNQVPVGVYMCSLSVNGYRSSKRLVVIR